MLSKAESRSLRDPSKIVKARAEKPKAFAFQLSFGLFFRSVRLRALRLVALP